MTVLVLNAGYEPLHIVTLQHAIRMLDRNVAVVEQAEHGQQFGPYPLPKVLRLVRYVTMRWRNRQPKWTRELLLKRDKHTCAYCSKPGTTIDHVTPLSRGGKTTWENTVTACKPCNSRKADRTPQEAGMTLRTQPKAPTWWEIATQN